MTTALVVASAGLASAQHEQSSPSASPAQRAFSLQSFAVFRDLMLQGDFSPKESLSDIMAKHPSTGVGAVSDARGEITILDGKLVVTYGKDGSAPTSESAALLAVGKVDAWQTVPVEADIAPAKIEAFLADMAKAHGIDPEKSFPFQIVGVISPYAMHNNAGPTGGPHGMGRPMAVTVERKGDQIAGRVAGFYVSSDLMGVFTHGGERTHSHWVAMDGGETAHLDQWGIKAGSRLLVPKLE